MSGTSHPSVVHENGSWLRGVMDARNVLVLEDPHSASAADHRCPETATNGPLLFVAFTGADMRLLEQYADEHRERYVVDAAPQGLSAGVESDRLTVESVSSPGNLTEVGVAIDKLLAGTGETNGRLNCCLPSLTALLQYVDRQRGYRFCNAMANRLASVDAFVHYHIIANAHDDRTVDTFASLMDAVVRVNADGTSEVRNR